MFGAMQTAKSGMITYEKALEISSGNGANSQTKGYSKTEFTIADLTHKKLLKSNNQLDRGIGSKIARTHINFSPGGLEETENFTCYAIDSENVPSFFKLNNGMDDKIYYTKLGNFIPLRNVEEGSAEEGTYYLGTVDSYFVLDKNGEKIKMDVNDMKAQLPVGIFKVSEPEKMLLMGNCRYEYTGTDEPVPNDEANLLQSYLEESNVNISDESICIMMSKQGHLVCTNTYNLAGKVQDEVTNLMG